MEKKLEQNRKYLEIIIGTFMFVLALYLREDDYKMGMATKTNNRNSIY